MSNPKLDFVKFDEVFLEMSWCWLNDPEIKVLTSTPNFTRQEQMFFFNSLPRDDYKVWGIKCDSTPVGVLGLKNIKGAEAEYFGYIGEKGLWGKRLFPEMLHFVVDVALSLGLRSIYLNVSSLNVRAIRAYRREGFKLVDSKSTSTNFHMIKGLI
ncbi:GNAT family N-acetyltransferase [Shewanella algae]|uniref:GNAT family N-acetyltransferase n=1 Tax=Shewanella algae TaxID=38313 RepID=UPI003AAAAD95